MDDAPAAETFEEGQETGNGLGVESTLRDQLVGDLAQRAAAAGVEEGEQAAVDEHQPSVPVAVGEGAEALRSQGHCVVQADVVAGSHRRWARSLSRRRTSRRS